ncbi:DUF2637 domain-containing protein [Streptantibioticus silvisoli]|uniref:DUF2637 domain-containing protein n=1 Tax=Streptantibioticus silvisoli TaxID=2705255 RepID=A0ABT6VWS4_9ACTN|nr:DUF2637 domain-containing protein [Streptantibioticus silvisoli]MDI5962939.1 DUF2637 domain-containing protein [Streptantibioticus silvisoli]
MALPSAHPARHRVTAWDRAAVVALGAAGCALSYDALQQMAVAIHVRGFLMYLFPLVIDGFIAYSVRALLVLRTAPFRARLYVWTLFGAATIASIWANALHAVRLNEQAPAGILHLGNGTVGILSTVAPLALAGAVHLHILITREATGTPSPEPAPTPDVPTEQPDPARRNGRPADATIDQLMEIGHIAAVEYGRLSRAVVLQAIRDKGLKVGGERLTEVMTALRTEADTTSETDLAAG